MAQKNLEIYTFEEASRLGLGKFELGGKGYGLVEMVKLGLPVPAGAVITTRMCREYFAANRSFPEGFEEAVRSKMGEIEKKSGKKFGDPKNPLLVSVRSGAPFSMPGMMDTVLNLGVNDEVAEGLATISRDRRFAFDTYRRFIQLFGKIVLKVPGEEFETILSSVKKEKGVKNDIELDATDWARVVEEFKKKVKEATGQEIPQDPYKQLFMAIAAVFDSWYNPRAQEYRKIYRISEELGTAVNIVEMVYGNYDDNSATGVAFTRNPSTGEKKLYGEYLTRAQGEDVVAGIRTPMPIESMQQHLPEAYSQLLETARKLEEYFKDMQDIEFTVERGRLYMLQTRTGKRTAQAAVKIAVDMVSEGLITSREAVSRVEPDQIDQLLHRQVNPSVKEKPIAVGIAASPGAAAGKVVFTDEDSVMARERGEAAILVRPETAPEDIAGIAASEGVLTSRGGKTSHAAVVTRGMGKPCIVGAEEIKIDLNRQVFEVNGIMVKKGDIITIDGSSGRVYLGQVEMIEPELTKDVSILLGWADSIRRLKIRANADTPSAASRARSFGAEGIGLTRTERMFGSEERLAIVQSMILAGSREERIKYLAELREMQKNDFKEILRVMHGLPVTVRLLDAPLHEFLPKPEQLIAEVAKLEVLKPDSDEYRKKSSLLKRVLELSEHNPMMGHRGVRVAMSYPEIYEAQSTALFEAAAELVKEGVEVDLEVMVPQVAEAEELRRAKEIIDRVADQVMEKLKVKVNYKVGTMIETPRAALTADEVAKHADFFSFGTNDLTQATFAFSRDDAEGKFMPLYLSAKILSENPFEKLDPKGVARLMKIAVQDGRQSNPSLKVGICGEHGGEPSSIEICDRIGLDYVSCSAFRVPVARLAAAQSVLKAEMREKVSSSV
ncbi:MAG: pyruvate, phosphate dikinase [Conexivisphaerales archaeon]